MARYEIEHGHFTWDEFSEDDDIETRSLEQHEPVRTTRNKGQIREN